MAETTGEKIKLNPEQKKAVEFEHGPLLVVAGAGTGKTRVIAQRIKHLIQKKVNPKEILALTFTEKAAGEMLERVDDVMPLGYEEPWLNTFHSFADRLLREEGLEIGLDPSFKILSTPEQWILFRKHIFDFNLKYFLPLGNPTKFISAILKFISRLQDENISTQQFEKFAKEFEGDKEEKERWEELAHTYKKYEQLKIENSAMDFGDLIIWAIKLFNERPNIRKKYQKQFKHVLVDEFQDTNHAQYELIKLLSPKKTLNKDTGRSLLVVGDDSQSIYKFRGAAVSNILEFMDDYPEAEMITLLKNYRSSQKILDPAYKLIKNNNPDTLESKLSISKELVSQLQTELQKNSPNPEVLWLENAEDQVDMVVRKILEIMAIEEQYTYKDFAILARANNHLDPFIFALRKYGLPYQLVGNRGLYDREEVRDIIALLKTATNPQDGLSLYRVLNIDSLEIPADIVSQILSDARYKKVSLWEVTKEQKDPMVKEFVELVREFQDLITKKSPSEYVYQIVNQIGYIGTFLAEETIQNQMSIQNLNLFLNIAKNFETTFLSDTKEIPTIVDFVDYLELLIEAGDNPAQSELEDFDTINLMTVHASKGLEFPVVFMVDLVSGRFPTRNRKDMIDLPDAIIKETLPTGDSHIQEERRLFYVGMTRAKKYLYLMGAKDYGGKREKKPSGYIGETGIKPTEISSDEAKAKKDQVGLFGVESGFKEPKAKKINNFVPKFLSYSQINTYETCPLQYKYGYVLGVPQPANHVFSFGNTIHRTLKDFHSRLIQQDVSLEELYEMYDKNWEPIGYLSEEHRQERYESGKKLLARYYDDNKDIKTKPVAFEKSFNIWIDGTKFFGYIDRIDKLPEGGVEIIDYKTGNPRDQKAVDKDAQVTFYAIAAKEALGQDPKKLSLYFLESGEKISTTRTEKQLEEKKEEVGGAVKKIKGGDFEANPGMHCNWCSYKDICPFANKG